MYATVKGNAQNILIDILVFQFVGNGGIIGKKYGDSYMDKREIYKKRMLALKADARDKFSAKRFVERHLQADGSVKIDVNIPEGMQIFDEMAPTDAPQLNSEIFRYIDDQAHFVPVEYDITVNFVGKTFDKARQKQIDELLHEHYNLQVTDKIKNIRSNRGLGIFLLVFGVIALAAYFFLALTDNNIVFHEVISIVGTFSVWEAVDCWLINGHYGKVELNNALQMALVKVAFAENAANVAA